MDIGAIYRRCDFQVHTPRDHKFSGAEYISDAERKVYSKRFIESCRSKQLHAVAITDHHDLVFFNHIKKASLEERYADGELVPPDQRIIVFPGMELTLDVPCQALLIFDSTLEITEELRTRIYTALRINSFRPKEESKATHPVQRLPFKSINDVYSALNSLGAIRNRFIIFPNVKENGSDSILREGFYNEYARGVFVGGYLDNGQYEKHKTKTGWLNVVSGKVAVYGNRSIGVFQTSDCRDEKFERLGTCSTWVKWSQPTAEGLRQACLAKDSRISQDTPEMPQTALLSLEVSGSSFLKDITVPLNPQFNVLIGGRGTGKSSILQYISWALGKDAEEKKKIELESFIKNTLGPEGRVLLVATKNGVRYQIERTLSDYKIKIGNQDWAVTTNKNIVDILQADAFSQKELSKHEKNRTDQLTQLIEYSINDALNSAKRQLRENGDGIKEASTTFETLVHSQRAMEEIANQIKSINEQLTKLSNELSDVPEEDKKILRDHNLIQNEKQVLTRSSTQLGALKEAIDQLLVSVDLTDLEVESAGILNEGHITSFINAHNEVLQSIRKKLQEAVAPDNAALSAAIEAIYTLHHQYDEKYEAAKSRQSRFETTIRAIEQLRHQLKVLIEDRTRIQSIIDKNKTITGKLWRLYHWRNRKNIENWEMVKVAKSAIVEKSDGTLQIELSSLSEIDHIVQKFIEHVTGSKGQPERTKMFFYDMKDGDRTYKNLLKFWLCLFRAKHEESDVTQIFREYGVTNNHLLEGDLKRIMDSLDISQIVEFSLTLPSYKLELKYKKDDKNIIPFEDASYGQQAGAILSILLNQETGPLIIDQPEDDLDNKVIHQITESIINAKKKRQLIFSSHNANIAVNGDADLILCFDHNADRSAGEIHTKGAIDNPAVKRLVKDIMEGGEKAFTLRQTKYGF